MIDAKPAQSPNPQQQGGGPLLHTLAIALSALLLWRFASGGNEWPLGLLALAPWMLALDRTRSLLGATLSGVAMSTGFTIAALWWFGAAFGAYVGLAPGTGIALMLLAAPLLQPQWIVFAVVRHVWRQRHSASSAALVGAAAWIGCEWLLPKLLGDTLGHGLQPALLFRQLADLGGGAALTVLLLLCNEAIAQAMQRGRHGARRALRPLAVASLLLAATAGYGAWRLGQLEQSHALATPSLRVGLVQANLTDYERRRETQGGYAVIREVLDTHYDMSEFAVREQGAEALLWSETVYPTTFGTPKSPDGEALDRELVGFVGTLGVPLLFGTYDRDAGGEYNSAALIDPRRGALGHYRKTHPFPLTEHVPAWLDGPWLRALLPWTGNWQAGQGARVLPLAAADGREIDVVPLICLDDVHPHVAIDGARLGARAIVGLSNDSWFSDYPDGARLHLGVASFRSIETRLPQLRVTTNGLSAVIDESGEVIAQTAIGQQAVLVGALPIADPLPTLMVRWGDWLGLAALLGLAGMLLGEGWRWQQTRRLAEGKGATPEASSALRASLLPSQWRAAAALLRLFAGAGLIWILLRMLLGDGLQVNSLGQIWQFGYAVAAPALAAWAIGRAFGVQPILRGDQLVLALPSQQVDVPLAQIARLRLWRIPLPGPGIDIEFASGRRWRRQLLLDNPQRLLRRLNEGGASTRWASAFDERIAEFYAQRSHARHALLDHPACKLFVFPLLLSLPAFHLHQVIAFGGAFGEWVTYGAGAWFVGLLIWWAAWIIGMSLLAAALRLAIETLCWLTLWLMPNALPALRLLLERGARATFYLGVPAWLLWRVLAG